MGLKLETVIQSQPKASCYWEFEGNEVSGNRYKIFSEGEKQILVIDSFEFSDAGKYVCVAENELGEAKWSANITFDKHKQGKSSPKNKRSSSPSKKSKKQKDKENDKKSPVERPVSRPKTSDSLTTLPPATPASETEVD